MTESQVGAHMMTPLPHQIAGARFLAARTFAVLADEPRVGKTGAAIMAADMALAENVLVVTTASGRPVWRRGFEDWQSFPRRIEVAAPKKLPSEHAQAVIVGWPTVANPHLHHALRKRRWDAIILDESHYAKNFGAKRTQAVFGEHALAAASDRVWCLTGTPMPTSPLDLFPMLRFGAPERIGPYLDEDSFLDQFCVWRPKRLNAWSTIKVVMEGKNLGDLRQRLDGLLLRRTQQDVGITSPIFDLLPVEVPDRARREAEKEADLAAVMKAIDSGSTRDLEMHLGPLRRLTGGLKTAPVVDLVKDEFECGLDKVVLAFWHTDVGAALAEGLAKFGVVGIDGATSASQREANVAAFSKPTGPRVFLAQIQAAGEAIDLSAAAELIFVEMSFVPKDGQQMAMRVTNHNQTRRPRVRVATMAGSIDEPIQQSLLRRIRTIQEVLAK